MTNVLRRPLTVRRASPVVGLLLSVVALFMATMSGQNAQAAAGTFEILAIMPFSGVAAVSGKAERAGMDAAVKTINNVPLKGKKGILGKRVNVTYKDDTSNGAKGTATALEEMGKKKYDMVMCGINAGVALPCTAAIGKQKVLQVIPSGISDLAVAKNYPNTFATLGAPTVNVDAAFARMKKDKKTKVAIMLGDSPAARDLAAAGSQQAGRFGISITGTTIVPAGTSDATPQIQKAMQDNPQAILVVGFSVLNVNIMKARAKLGVTVPVYMDPTASPFNYGSVLSDAERKGQFISGFGVTIAGNKDTKTRAAKLFYKNVKVYDPKPALSLIAHMVSYNAIMLTRAAAVNAKSTDAGKMIKAMGQIKKVSQAPGVVGLKTVYSKKGSHAPQIQPNEFTFIKAGNLVDGVQVPGS